MTRVEKMRGARDAYSRRLMDFVKTVEDDSGIHCFYEGECGAYYDFRVTSRTDRKVFEYRCSGRSGVLSALTALLGNGMHKERSDVAFFVDRDFCLPSPPESEWLFVTDGYSLENYYLTKCALRSVLEKEFSLDPQDHRKVIDKVFGIVYARMQELSEMLTGVNAWAWAYHEMWDSDPSIKRLRLSSYRVDYFVSLSLDGNTKKYMVEGLADKFGCPAPSMASIERKIACLIHRGDPLEFLRGKWLLEGLCYYLRCLKVDRGKKHPVYFDKRERGACTKAFSVRGVLSELTQHAYTSPRLKEFLARYQNSAKLSVVSTTSKLSTAPHVCRSVDPF